ncbi:hypothetical protein ATY81_01770 [Rhizobium sp. R72]|nr:hypothetical protein ATY81_01770 [Rhizobium sp. R72]OWW05788.1 hypothetical protein ATY80_01770 [Rhizobium sp. R711]
MASLFLRKLSSTGNKLNEIGIFVRSNDKIALTSKVARPAMVKTTSSPAERNPKGRFPSVRCIGGLNGKIFKFRWLGLKTNDSCDWSKGLYRG